MGEVFFISVDVGCVPVPLSASFAILVEYMLAMSGVMRGRVGKL